MKPFNLEEAKAGKQIVTRGGREVRFVAHVGGAYEAQRVVSMFMDSLRIFTSYEDGRYAAPDQGSAWDLFMVSEKVSGWVNLYKDSAMLRTGTYVYGTKEEAKTHIECGNSYLTTFYVELEV